MDVAPSAEIFAFPAQEPSLRLRTSLRALNAALDEQREAVAQFRASLQALRGATQGLGTSLGDLQGKLRTLDDQVHGLGQIARETADGL